MKRIPGFTLIELAILLMVLALLVSGILKLQELSDPHIPKPPAVNLSPRST